MASLIDLVSLGDLKSWLNIATADDDALLSRLITQISSTILSYIERPAILPQIYTENYDGGNDVSVMLRQWPVISITSCLVDGAAIPPFPLLQSGAGTCSGYILDPAAIAPPGAMQRLSLRGTLFTCGLQNVTISYSAGYQISDELAAISLAAPYSVSAQAPYGRWTRDVAVAFASGMQLTAVADTPSAGQYSVSDGVYTFSPADAGSAILLSYGYVPADLASCCMDWVAERYAYRTRIGQRSKSLGGQETISFVTNKIPDFVAGALAPYRRVVMP